MIWGYFLWILGIVLTIPLNGPLATGKLQTMFLPHLFSLLSIVVGTSGVIKIREKSPFIAGIMLFVLFLVNIRGLLVTSLLLSLLWGRWF